MAGARARGVVIAVATVLLVPRTASAHDPRTEVRIAGERIEIRAFYSDGRRAIGAEVTLVDTQGNVIHAGRTNQSGEWTCAKPSDGEYRIVWDGGDGHADEKKLVLRPPPQSTVSAGPRASRAEVESDDFDAATRTPWLRLAIGVAAIVGFALAIVIAHRIARPKASET